MPKNNPEIVNVPKINFIVVRGKGNPNEEDGEYKATIGLLYGIAFTIKMSKKGSHKMEGYFDYVVPPLEGFWWQEDTVVGPYDAEPATVAQMDLFLQKNGYVNDFSEERLHHEIYLSDARRVAPEKQKMVIRHPIKKATE